MLSSDFKDLLVWQKAMKLAVDVYNLMKKFPDDEKFGLISQIKRSAVSVPSNIAEGQGRYNVNEFIHFIFYSRGSLAELETQLILSVNLGFADMEEVQPILNDIHTIGKFSWKLISSLEQNNRKRRKI